MDATKEKFEEYQEFQVTHMDYSGTVAVFITTAVCIEQARAEMDAKFPHTLSLEVE